MLKQVGSRLTLKCPEANEAYVPGLWETPVRGDRVRIAIREDPAVALLRRKLDRKRAEDLA
jgi:hypothetical protein